MKWVLCDQGNFRPRRFIDRTCQPTVEPETSLGVQASKAVHQCLFSRIAWRRKRATNHFLNQFGKTEAESKSHLFKRKKHPKHPQILRVFPLYFQDVPHLSTSWIHHIFNSSAPAVAHAASPRLRCESIARSRQPSVMAPLHRDIQSTREGSVAGHFFLGRICRII